MNKLHAIFNILNSSQKREGILLLFIISVGTIIEAVGIGLIIPFLTLIMNPDSVNEYLGFSITDDYGLSNDWIIIIATSFMLIVYFAKAIYLTYKSNVQASYVYRLQANLSNRLFSDYIRRPYTFHLQVNSSKLIHNIVVEIQHFIQVVVNGLILLSELLLVMGLMILMFVIDIKVALIVTISFMLFSVIMHFRYKDILYSLGRERQKQENIRQKHLQQSFGGIKEIKLFGGEVSFTSWFEIPTNNLILINKKHQVSLEMPRIWLESFVIVIFSIIVSILVIQSDDASEIVPLMGMFAAIAIRVMPSINRVIFNIQQIKFYSPTIEVMYDELSSIEDHNEEKQETSSFDFNKEIVLSNVSYSYPESDMQILHNINTKIRKNSLVGVVGKSGAGKSTLIDLVLGMIEPNKGNIEVDGNNISSNIRGWQKNIGYIPQTVYLTDDSIKSNIAFGVNIDEIDDIRLHYAIRSAQLDTFVSSLPNGIETLVGECGSRISGGQRQRVGIARALYNDPEVLVMDEATSALDKETEMQLMNLIKDISQSKTVIFVTHRESVINYCDKVLMLENGNLTEVHS